MTRHAPDWYDAQYNARASIPDHPAILQGWFSRSAVARDTLPCTLDVPYGSGPGEDRLFKRPFSSQNTPRNTPRRALGHAPE